MRYVVCGLLMMAFGVVSFAQTPSPAASESRFDVASIKPSEPNRNSACQPPTCYTSFLVPQPGHFRAFKMSVAGLVGFVYSMSMNRIVGPDWTKSEQYDIEASHSSGPGQSSWQPMLRHLLDERFSLKMHHEQRRMAVWVLTKVRDDGKLGPQLVRVTGCEDRPKFLPSAYDGSCGVSGVPSATSRVGLGTWANLGVWGQFQQSVEDRPVVDETGLEGWFAYFVEWSDDPSQVEKPSLFTAVREQLGLKLEAAERPLDVIVIDSVERPTPN